MSSLPVWKQLFSHLKVLYEFLDQNEDYYKNRSFHSNFYHIREQGVDYTPFVKVLICMNDLPSSSLSRSEIDEIHSWFFPFVINAWEGTEIWTWKDFIRLRFFLGMDYWHLEFSIFSPTEPKPTEVKFNTDSWPYLFRDTLIEELEK